MVIVQLSKSMVAALTSIYLLIYYLNDLIVYTTFKFLPPLPALLNGLGLLVYGEYEWIDALGTGAEVLRLGHRAQLQACGGPELATWPDATALRTRRGVRARSLLAASIAPVLAYK